MVKEVILTYGGGTYTTSIKEYAEELIKISTDEKEIAVAKALLNYGAAAQIYFTGKNGNPDTLDDVLANAGLSEEDKTVTGLSAQELKDYKYVRDEDETPETRFDGVSFILSSKTYMKVYFAASASATVTVGGEEYAPTLGTDGYYYVIITLPNPVYAKKAFDIVITDGSTIVSAAISAYTAIEAAISNPEPDEDLIDLIPLLNAYTDYCERTVEYVSES